MSDPLTLYVEQIDLPFQIFKSKLKINSLSPNPEILKSFSKTVLGAGIPIHEMQNFFFLDYNYKINMINFQKIAEEIAFLDGLTPPTKPSEVPAYLVALNKAINEKAVLKKFLDPKTQSAIYGFYLDLAEDILQLLKKEISKAENK